MLPSSLGVVTAVFRTQATEEPQLRGRQQGIMASSYRAPKQWALASDATVNSYEAWKNNLIFTLSLDSINTQFLKDNATWGKLTKANPDRGFTGDDTTVEQSKRLTASQKASALNLMLGQIANYSPINRNTIVKNSTCLNDVWKAIRQHYGFQAEHVSWT